MLPWRRRFEGSSVRERRIEGRGVSGAGEEEGWGRRSVKERKIGGRGVSGEEEGWGRRKVRRLTTVVAVMYSQTQSLCLSLTACSGYR